MRRVLGVIFREEGMKVVRKDKNVLSTLMCMHGFM
jgi:hypothetical protein